LPHAGDAGPSRKVPVTGAPTPSWVKNVRKVRKGGGAPSREKGEENKGTEGQRPGRGRRVVKRAAPKKPVKKSSWGGESWSNKTAPGGGDPKTGMFAEKTAKKTAGSPAGGSLGRKLTTGSRREKQKKTGEFDKKKHRPKTRKSGGLRKVVESAKKRDVTRSSTRSPDGRERK